MNSDTMPRRRRLAGWLGAVLLALVSPMLTGAALAALDPGDEVFIGSKEGYGGTGLFPIWEGDSAQGDPDYWAYCIEHDVPARTGTTGIVHDLDDFLGANYFNDAAVRGKVFWVLANSYPELSLEAFATASGASGLTRSDAIEATQYAIWRYTDLTWDAEWSFETPASRAAYWYLVDGANASDGLTPGDLAVTATVTAPAAPQAADTLVGPFVVHTNQDTVTVTVDPAVTLTDAQGDSIDPAAVVDGQEIFLDLRGRTDAGSAEVTVVATGSSATGKIISVPAEGGGEPTPQSHAQTIILVTPESTKTTDRASVDWSAAPVEEEPSIGTSLVDAADDDQILPWTGGTVTDTVTYQNLTPGTEYTLTGELMTKPDADATGITGTVTFTPTEPDGEVDVTFTVPEGHAGQQLVAFEYLHTGTDTTGDPIAAHDDIDDPAQTVTIEDQPDDPAIGTSLVDAADDDQTLPWTGGTVTDTVTYQNLTPGTEYTLTGELMTKPDADATGITGTVTFTPTEPDGEVDVTFTVPEGHAGQQLVAFEYLHTGTDTTGDPIAAHDDIDDPAQTVTIEDQPDDPGGPGPDDQDLPNTGASPFLAAAAVLAAVSLIAGTALLLRHRRA